MEAAGVVGAVIHPELGIALIERERLIIPPGQYSEVWNSWTENGIPHPTEFQIGITQFEITQGIDTDFIEEIESEVGCHIKLLAKLGHVNHSGYFATSPEINIYLAYPDESLPLDRKEPIKKVVWFSPEKLAEITSLSGSTYSALFMALRWMAGQKEKVWQEFAKRVFIKWSEA
jgi:hypothetical protein